MPTVKHPFTSAKSDSGDATLVNASNWNADHTVTFVGVNVKRTADKSISHNSETVLDLDEERFDTHGFHDNSTNNSRLTIPSGMGGYYLITLSINWASSQTSGVREGRITLNSTPTYLVLATSDVDSAHSHRNAMSCIRNLSVGDYVEARVFQTNDASAAIQLLCSNIFEFSMTFLGV